MNLCAFEKDQELSTKFFSSFDKNYVFGQLKNFVASHSQTFTTSSRFLRVDFTVQTELDEVIEFSDDEEEVKSD